MWKRAISLEKQDKAIREQISRARQLEEDLIREDLCDADHISALNSKTKMHMSAPIRMIGTMRVATSVGQSSKSTGTRSGRYRPNRSKTFVNRLQTAKREKEDLKIKSVDSSTAYNRLTYIVVNIREKSNHKVEIGKSPFCDYEDFTKNSAKEI